MVAPVGRCLRGAQGLAYLARVWSAVGLKLPGFLPTIVVDLLRDGFVQSLDQLFVQHALHVFHVILYRAPEQEGKKNKWGTAHHGLFAPWVDPLVAAPQHPPEERKEGSGMCL